MSANTAISGIVSGDSWDTVVVNTVTSAISTAMGTKVGNLVGNKVVSALNNLGLSERAAYALAASSNGVSFAVTQSALEETKSAFMYGAEYKPDAASIAANIITSILFGSLEAFKNNPKAAELQNRLKQGDASAQKETADFLNEQADNALTAQEQSEQYIKQWPNAQRVESGDVNGYNCGRFYENAVKNAGETFHSDNVLTLSTRFANKMDLIWKNSGNIKPIEGYQDIVCHGDTLGFSYKDLDGNEINMTPREFAEILKNSPVYEGRPIRLISCQASADGSFTAQYVANHLGVDILAPTDTVFVYPDGEIIIGPDKYHNTGTWKIFKPRG